jgi:hypothetical protein
MGQHLFSGFMKNRLAIVTLLVAAYLPSYSFAEQVEFTSIRFFESGDREYSREVKDPSKPVPLAPIDEKVFVQGLTRYLYCQVSFLNRLQNIRDQNVRLSLKGYMSDGSFLGEISDDMAVDSVVYGDWFIKRLPWQEPGNWATGTYTVEVYLDGLYAGRGNFDVSSSLDSLHMKFFESGYDVPSEGSRTYATSFAQNSARYINCEASFSSLHDSSLSRTLQFTLKYYNSDGSLMGAPSLDIKSYQIQHNIHMGWGWQEPGHWAPGTYTVEAYLDGGYIGKSSYDVYGPSSANEGPFEIGKKLALAGRYDEQTGIWVKDNWTGDGDTYSFHVEYDKKRDEVVFCERPLSGKGLMVMWLKNYGANEFVKLIGGTASNTSTDVIPIARELAEREAGRILKNFDY